MGASNLTSTQRLKEVKVLKKFLLWSVLGSLGLHAIVLASNPPNLQLNSEANDEEEIEIIAETPVEEPKVEEPEPPEPEIATVEELPQEIAIASPEIPPPLPALAPESQAPQPTGEDAPSDKPLPPSSETVNPLTGTTDELKAAVGGGPISRPGGEGNGFGEAKNPTGFVPEGKPDGKPDGKPNGKPDGKPNSIGTRSNPPAIPGPTKPGKPQCVSCPKPRYRGKEGIPRVTYDIAPDGRVINVRLRKSSGDPQTDREALEAMSKWQFDPKTIPEGGQRNVRTRFTFEEEGSTFQRQNEQRRREQEEQRRVAEQEHQRQEAERQNQSSPITTTERKPTVPDQPTIPASPSPVVETSTPIAPLEPSAPPPVETLPAPPPIAPPQPVPEDTPAPAVPQTTDSNSPDYDT